jgi:hypothetical protein
VVVLLWLWGRMNHDSFTVAVVAQCNSSWNGSHPFSYCYLLVDYRD